MISREYEFCSFFTVSHFGTFKYVIDKSFPVRQPSVLFNNNNLSLVEDILDRSTVKFVFVILIHPLAIIVDELNIKSFEFDKVKFCSK